MGVLVLTRASLPARAGFEKRFAARLAMATAALI